MLMAVLNLGNAAVNNQDTRFFKALGARIAEARKAQNLTQQQVAERLGIAQQTYAGYEVGHTRIPASMLPTLAQDLGTTLDELMGQNENLRVKPGPASKLQKQFDRISQLSKTKQRFVSEVLEAVIIQASH